MPRELPRVVTLPVAPIVMVSPTPARMPVAFCVLIVPSTMIVEWLVPAVE